MPIILTNCLKQLTPIVFVVFAMYSYTAQANITLTIENLQTYLTESESAFTDLVDGADKHIRWQTPENQQTALAIVYLHGFSASRQELSPVTELIADRLQANVYYARLQGHGRSDDAMAESSIDGWKRDTLEAYAIGALIGKQVIVVSTSTGGTLATWLAAQNQTDDMLANIMISPNFGVKSRAAGMVRWSWGLWLAKAINGDYNSFTPMSEQHADYWTERYPLEAVVPMLNLVDEVDTLDKSAITIPQLIVYSPDDKVIDVEAVVNTSRQFINSEVELVAFTESQDPYQHVLAGIACSPASTEAMVELITDYITEQQKLKNLPGG